MNHFVTISMSFAFGFAVSTMLNLESTKQTRIKTEDHCIRMAEFYGNKTEKMMRAEFRLGR